MDDGVDCEFSVDGDGLTMEHVLKVLLQFCEDYFGKYAPSKKDIHAVISLLEREREVKTPHEILDNRGGMISPLSSRNIL